MVCIDHLGTVTFRISGGMIEGYRDEIETFLGSHWDLPSMVVDLYEVTHVDRAGEEVLCWLSHHGAESAADNLYALNVCEQLRLSIARPRPLPPGSRSAARTTA